MVSEVKSTSISPALQRRIAEHRLEVARLREELGDPEEALRRWVQKNLTPEAVRETLDEMIRDGASWIEYERDDQTDG